MAKFGLTFCHYEDNPEKDSSLNKSFIHISDFILLCYNLIASLYQSMFHLVVFVSMLLLSLKCMGNLEMVPILPVLLQKEQENKTLTSLQIPAPTLSLGKDVRSA